MFVLSGALDAFGNADQSITKEVVNKYVFKLLYIAVGIGFSAFIEGVCWTRTAEKQTSRIRMEYLKSVLRQEVGFFDNRDGSSTTFQVVSSISADAHLIQDVIAEKIPTFLTQFCAFIFNLLVSFLLSWRLALASLPFAIGFIVPGVVFGKLMMNLGIKSKDAYGLAGSIAEQAISSIRTVYSYVGEHQTLVRFSHALQGSMNLGMKQGLVKGLLIGSMGMVFVTWAFQSWFGSILVIEKGERGGHVFISGLCVILGGWSLMSALPNLPSITEASAAAKGIFELIDRIPQIDSENANGKVLANVRGQIEFREVHFSYPSRKDSLILQGFNMQVKPGMTVGLVGGSGSGKSTVVSLLERFYDPVKGDILLDGHRIKKFQLKWLRSQMGLVNQQPILFATSIKENILFGKEDASMEQVISAAKAANAHDFINKLPEGYDTQVGEFGIQLSGGQKQRIAISRALLKDPRILLLDEATSALDAQSESIVQAAIDQVSVGRTTIIIAHRLSTIREVNKILVLQSGRVVESGSHDELMQKNNGVGEGGVYFEMMKVQQSAVQNQVLESSQHSIGERPYNKTTYAHTPNSPFIVRSSRQNSPATAFSPTLTMSEVASIQNSPASTFSFCSDGNIEKLESTSPNLSNWRLIQMNKPEWKRALLGCLGAVVFGTIQPIYSYCMGTMISVYFIGDNSKLKSETRFYCIVFLVIGLISFFANLLQHYNFAIMGERLTKRVREELLQKVLTFEVGWFDLDENKSAAVCARLSTEANIVRSLVGDRMSLLVQVFTNAALAFALALIVAWKVAIVMIAIQPLTITSFYSKGALMKRMSENAQKAQSEGSQLASEAVVNHRTITAFSSQKRILDLFAATLKGQQKQSIKQSWLSGVGLFTSQLLTTCSIALIFWYGGTLMNGRSLSSKDLFLVFFILMSTGKTIADAGTMTSDLSKGSNAIKSTLAILDRNSEIEPNNPEGSKIKKMLTGRIELKNVFFAYPSRPEQMIFQGLNLTIEAGKTVALVGQSGSGKSTVFGLIERFYDPMKGSVLIDDHDVKSYNLRDLRSHIALVSQEPTLFAGTIHENIVYGKKDATEAEIKEAAMLANAHEFISSMKDGYQTYCGERGVQLSGGQKQRVALARAILKNPSVLLLDEATSALDSLAENIVQEALERMMVGSLGDSLAAPLTMFVLSGALDAFGSADQSIAKEVVNEYAVRLLYIAVGVGFSAFIEGVCWTRTAEWQTSCIQKEYLKSILRQEVSFFDKQDVSSSTLQVVSNISADAHLIQDVMAEKIPTCLTQLCAFIFNLLVSFLLSWQLALASLPFAVGFIVPGVGFGKLMMNLGIKSKEAYGVVGGIAEHAISSIQTMYSYVGEHQTLKRFSHALQRSMNLGIKQGLVKGSLIGSMEASAAAKGIFELIDHIPQIDSESDKGKVLENVRGQIEFRAVYFSYPSRMDSVILQGFNMLVKPGMKNKKTLAEMVEISDGAGQSTANSLCNVHKGKYTVWKGRCFNGTGYKCGEGRNAHDFVDKLPEGYDTQVGEFGIQLSRRQKQIIAIARALLKDPRILLLDEATTALDEQSERRIVESGSHDELMQINDGEGGVYYGMMKVIQSAVENNAHVSPHHPIEGRHYDKTMYAHTSKSPFSATSSKQNSPASAQHLS
ncbi:unnamed protein product [Fraxinus pennsylvanica]|uniref:Uncharacterized protein n=1 Tax=Fraxinus pennsylvanica TaxID=56036 RepID=A0AAD2ACB4_9LAMI|nr:unnamed protein product [Fraxinus pennsylvanica]